MICTITIKIGESTFTIEGVDSSQFSSADGSINDAGLAQILSQSELWNEALNTLPFYYKDKVNIEGQSIYEGQVRPNTTVSKLKRMFPKILFGNLEANILFVPKLLNYPSVARTQTPGGQIVYIVDSNPNNLRKLAKYLSIIEAVGEGAASKIQGEELKTLQLILEIVKDTKKIRNKPTNISDLIVDFLNHRNNYINVMNGKESILSQLDRIVPEIENLHWKRKVEIKDYKLRNLYTDCFKFGNGELYIPLKEFKKFLEVNYGDSNAEKVSKTMNQENGSNPYEIIINTLFKNERGFPYTYQEVRDDKIIIQKTFGKIGETYGIGFDTIQTFNSTVHKGWRIYLKSADEFFITPYQELTPNTSSKAYASLKEAIQAIDELLKKLSFSRDFLKGFFESDGRVRKLPKVLLENSIIKVRRTSLPNADFRLHPKENVLRQSLNEFLALFESEDEDLKGWKEFGKDVMFKDGNLVLSDINDIALFLYFLQEQENRNREDFETALQKVLSLPYDYYFVESFYKDKGFYMTKVLKFLSDPSRNIQAKEKTLKGLSYPKIKFWETVGDTFSLYFGVNILVLSASEIEQQFPSENSSIKRWEQKAFINDDGTIYINSTLANTNDLFHEYGHIILGLLRERNREVYENILLLVWGLTNKSTKDWIQNTYSGYSYIAQLEENFVRQFGDFVNHKTSTKIKALFQEGNSDVETIFGGKTLEDLGNKSVLEIFGELCEETSNALKREAEMFRTYISSGKLATQAKKTNWIRKLILEGNLEEFNCR